MGLQQCTKAWITPPNSCLPNPPGWDGVDLKLNAECPSGASNPIFTLKNKGSAMSSQRPYQVYVDSALAYTGNVQLPANDSLVFMVPVSGNSRVRVEIVQSANHPFEAFAFAEIQCQGNAPARISFSPITGEPETSVDCMPIRDSYDPNDKQVQPQGITSEGRIEPGRPLEYKIRFQNTGNDIAYRVVLVDTLSEHFDLTTFEELGSSHAYSLSLAGRGKPVLRFTFNDINLPDSLSNPEGSNGFIRFRVSPKSSAPIGTKLFNHAEIYFDFNYPIITNQILNTLYVPTVTNGIIDSVIVLSTNETKEKQNVVSIVPNPNSGRFETYSNKPSTVTLYSTSGKRLFQSGEENVKHTMDLSSFPKGLYLLEFSCKGERTVKKLILE